MFVTLVVVCFQF